MRIGTMDGVCNKKLKPASFRKKTRPFQTRINTN